MKFQSKRLIPSRSAKARELDTALRRKVIGQDDAIDAMVGVYEQVLAGLNAPNHPLANVMFLGPTGVGKTRLVEAMAEALFGDTRAVTKIDCGELQLPHEIAKLIGSPPGYLGHRETMPRLTQEALNQWHTEQCRVSLVLFDEIEKASDVLWQMLLGILDKATLTLGDNRRVDFSQSIVFMTSNVGAREISDAVGQTGVRGFAAGVAANVADEKWNTKKRDLALSAMKKKFSPEFVNRLDKTIVFNNLNEGMLESILQIELGMVQQRILQASGGKQFVFSCTESAKRTILREGFDPVYGGRALKRVIEKRVVQPLSALVSAGEINLGDFIRVSDEGGTEFEFTLEATGALVPALMEKYGVEYVTQAQQVPPKQRAARTSADPGSPSYRP